MTEDTVPRQFAAALDRLIAQVKQDRSIVAGVLGGSLSHDTVWARSDIDLVLVTVDDRKVESSSLSLYADGVNVHAILLPRARFRAIVDGSLHNSFMHSFLAKGRLLYTHDPSVADACARLADIGRRDTAVQLLRAGTEALPPLYKARKWLVTRGDFEYTALWILYAAEPLARCEVLAAGRLADREVIPQALALNPAFFKVIYRDLLNAEKSRGAVEAALEAAEAYVGSRIPTLFGTVLDYLRDAGEARSCREIDDHFTRHFDVRFVTTACEYLADQGHVEKVSIAARLTKLSTVDVQELAFVHLDGPDDGNPFDL